MKFHFILSQDLVWSLNFVQSNKVDACLFPSRILSHYSHRFMVMKESEICSLNWKKKVRHRNIAKSIAFYSFIYRINYYLIHDFWIEVKAKNYIILCILYTICGFDGFFGMLRTESINWLWILNYVHVRLQRRILTNFNYNSVAILLCITFIGLPKVIVFRWVYVNWTSVQALCFHGLLQNLIRKNFTSKFQVVFYF